MRIDLNPGTGVGKTQTAQTTRSRPNAASTAGTDESRFAESETSVGKLAAAALNAPEVRLAKVQELKAQIHAGTYQVSAEQVAASMLEQMRVRAS
jgi:flagellar biosynthesis anti-sigma factor FlgM